MKAPETINVSKWQDQESPQKVKNFDTNEKESLSLLDKIRAQNKQKQMREKMQKQVETSNQQLQPNAVRGRHNIYPQSSKKLSIDHQPERSSTLEEKDQHPDRLQHYSSDQETGQAQNRHNKNSNPTQSFAQNLHEYQTLPQDSFDQSESQQKFGRSKLKNKLKEVDYTNISLSMIRNSQKGGSEQKALISLTGMLPTKGSIMQQARLSSIDTHFKQQIEQLKSRRESQQRQTPHEVSMLSQVPAPEYGITPKQLRTQPFVFKNNNVPRTQHQRMRREEPTLQDNDTNVSQIVKRVGTTTTATSKKRIKAGPESSIKQTRDNTQANKIFEESRGFSSITQSEVGSVLPQILLQRNTRNNTKTQQNDSHGVGLKQAIQRNMGRPRKGEVFSSGGFRSTDDGLDQNLFDSIAGTQETNKLDRNLSSVQTKKSSNVDIYQHQGINQTSMFGKKRKKKDEMPRPIKDLLREFKNSGQPNISTKVVTASEFEKLAREKEKDGVPMLEKTIFIVKPIFVPINGLTEKKQFSSKKEIYTQKLKAPVYQIDRQPASPRGQRKLKTKKSRQEDSLLFTNRSYKRGQKTPSRSPRVQNKEDSLEKQENKHSPTEGSLQVGRTMASVEDSNSIKVDHRESNFRKSSAAIIEEDQASQLKQILNMHTIDVIFKRRQEKLERTASQLKKETDDKAHTQPIEQPGQASEQIITPRKRQEEELSPRQTRPQKSTARKPGEVPSLPIEKINQPHDKLSSVQPSGIKEVVNDAGSISTSIMSKNPHINKFQEQLNSQLIASGHGIQIIMQDSKNKHFFKAKERDMQRLMKQNYEQVKNWRVDPFAVEATVVAPSESLSKRERRKYLESIGSTEKDFAVTNSSAKKIIDDQQSIQKSMLDKKKLSLSPIRAQQTAAKAFEPIRAQQSAAKAFESRSYISQSKSQQSNSKSKSKSPRMQAISSSKDNNQLTHERVHALKVIAENKQLVPIFIENKLCSHVPEKFAITQVVQANDLNSLDKNNPFRFWQDRERRSANQKQPFVPKNFYTSYKSQLMRDAHEIARSIASQSAIETDSAHACLGALCDCHRLTNNKKLKRRGFRIKSKHKREERKANVEQLHNPYKPCRKTCSCTHNPLFHAERMQKEHLDRLHASATKLMIMSVVPARPKSADSADRKQKEYYQEIDYTGSSMYGEILQKKFKKMLLQKQEEIAAQEMGNKVDELKMEAEKKNSANAIAKIIQNSAGYPSPLIDKISVQIKAEVEKIFLQVLQNKKDQTPQQAADAANEQLVTMLDILLEPAAQQIDIDKAVLIKQAKQINTECVRKSFAHLGTGLQLTGLGGSSRARLSQIHALSKNKQASCDDYLGDGLIYNQSGLLGGNSGMLGSQNKLAGAGGYNEGVINNEDILHKENTYSPLEITYNMSLLKHKSIRQKEISDHHIEEIYMKARKTLKYAMKKLLLTKQFYLIDAQYKRAENGKQTAENVIKLLIRIQKMHEAQQEITKILVLISQRVSKMVELTHELKHGSRQTDNIKQLYADSVRLSSRIFVAIQELKYNEKALNRPFVFKGIAYDEFMNKEIRVVRYKILKQYPELEQDPDLRLFLRANGDVGDTRIARRVDYELPKDYISDSDDSEDEIQNRDSYQQIAQQHSNLQTIKHAPFSRSMQVQI